MCIRTCAPGAKKSLQKTATIRTCARGAKKAFQKKERRKKELRKKAIVMRGEEPAVATGVMEEKPAGHSCRCGHSSARLVSRQRHRLTPAVAGVREGGEGETAEDYRQGSRWSRHGRRGQNRSHSLTHGDSASGCCEGCDA